MSPFTTLDSAIAHLPIDDVDTDQIIPARFLKVTTKDGLGEHLFADRPDFPPLLPGAAILRAGVNFGCGSSREHAPWALTDHGFRAIIARSFADIFRENATKNGLLTIAIDGEPYDKLSRAVWARIDLPSQRVTLASGERLAFEIDPFAKHCLTSGLDELGYILSFADRIAAHERR